MVAATPRDDDDENDDDDDTGIGKMVPRTSSSSSFPETIGRPHGVIAEHTAHRTNDADGGWTNTVPHPVPPSGEPVHVIRGMCVCARVVLPPFLRAFCNGNIKVVCLVLSFFHSFFGPHS